MNKLDDLGSRICILGPGNSGKSTLAQVIARKRGLPANRRRYAEMCERITLPKLKLATMADVRKFYRAERLSV